MQALQHAIHSRALRQLLKQKPRRYRVNPPVFEHGDWVYYRRPVEVKGQNPFRGPAQVIGHRDHIVLLDHGGRCVHAHPDDLLPVRERLAGDDSLAKVVTKRVEETWPHLDFDRIMSAAAPVVVSDSLGLAKVKRSGLAKDGSLTYIPPHPPSVALPVGSLKYNSSTRVLQAAGWEMQIKSEDVNLVIPALRGLADAAKGMCTLRPTPIARPASQRSTSGPADRFGHGEFHSSAGDPSTCCSDRPIYVKIPDISAVGKRSKVIARVDQSSDVYRRTFYVEYSGVFVDFIVVAEDSVNDVYDLLLACREIVCVVFEIVGLDAAKCTRGDEFELFVNEVYVEEYVKMREKYGRTFYVEYSGVFVDFIVWSLSSF
eukprot:gene18043-biopygen3701